MGIFKKFVSLLSGENKALNDNIQAEKTLNNIIENMEDELKKAEIDVAQTIAVKNTIENKLTTICNEIEELEKTSITAMNRGEEALSNKALSRINALECNKEAVGTELDMQKKSVLELKEQLISMEHRLEEAKNRRDSIVAHSREVEARKQIYTVASKLSGIDLQRAFENTEERADEVEAQANALSEIDKIRDEK